MSGAGCCAHLFQDHVLNAPPIGWLLWLMCAAFALMPVYPQAAFAAEEAASAVSSYCRISVHDPSFTQRRPAEAAEPAPVYRFEVVARYPHDSDAFTQGLTFYGGDLFESTGLYGGSTIRLVDLATGAIMKQRHLAEQYFGEGLTIVDGWLVQLTWRSEVAFVYDPVDLHKVDEFPIVGEGWGSTTLNGRLVISDGSSWLRFLDPFDKGVTGAIQVTEQGRPVTGLNELEVVQGLIYANVYPSDCLAMIDPASGRVTGWLDLGSLVPLSERSGAAAVPNGIAYNAKIGGVFVTGKLWPYIYQLRITDKGFPRHRSGLRPRNPAAGAQP